MLPWQYIPGNDNVFNFNIALFGKIKKLDISLYNRNWQQRSEYEYFKICTCGMKTSQTTVVSRFKYLEIFLAYINICNYGNLAGLDRDRLIDIVIRAMIKTKGKSMLKELRAFHKFLNSDVKFDKYSRHILMQKYETAKFYLLNIGLQKYKD